MLGSIKQKFCEFLRSLEYNVSDTGTYREEFPWLKLRLNDAKVLKTKDLTMTDARLVVDIFSNYDGEKEILEIIDDINAHIRGFISENDFIQYAFMRSLRIIDDPETGPLTKHGIATFSFVLTTQEDEEDGE